MMNPATMTSYAGPDELAAAAAASWLDDVDRSKRQLKQHVVALSGGRISRLLFSSIAAQARARNVALDRVHFFWADERCVPPDDPESNYRVARELLFAPLNIGDSQIHRLAGEKPPQEAALAAQEELCRLAPLDAQGQPVLDWIFLGLGEDGHVASLFPGEDAGLIRDPAVYRVVLDSPKPPPVRITLGYPAILAARRICMLASGAGKEAALRQSLAPDGNTPFARVLRKHPRTDILTDISLS